MPSLKWISAIAAVATVVVATWAWRTPADTPEQAASSGDRAGIITSHVPVPPPATSGSASPAPLTSGPPAAPPRAPEPSALVASISPPDCRVNDQGQLLLDQRAREDMDLLVSTHTPDQAMAKLQEACGTHPQQVQQAMHNVYQQYVQYVQAIQQQWPVDEQAAIPLDQLENTLHKGLKELRVQYFGAERACAMFCEEERLTTRMLSMAVAYARRHPEVSTEQAIQVAQSEVMKEVMAKGALDIDKTGQP